GDGECATGHCVDGSCCDTACNGQCQACDVAGSIGTCSTLASGAPHGSRSACGSDGSACGGSCNGSSAIACAYPGVSTQCRAASCSNGVETVAGSVGTCSAATGAPHGARSACASDGTVCGGSCDGVHPAACTYPGSSISCRDPSCTGGIATLAASCDGAGACPALQTQTCAPFSCGPTACTGNCNADSDCSSGTWCSAGVCVPLLAPGQACGGANQCGSQHCVDGVCCDTACTSQCEACAESGS